MQTDQNQGFGSMFDGLLESNPYLKQLEKKIILNFRQVEEKRLDP